MKKLSIFFLYLIYFLDVAGVGLVFVIFAPLLIDPSSKMLPTDMPVGERNILLGVLFAAYPLTQFFAAPILGEYSDQIGRKKPLFLATIATAITYGLSAIAIIANSYLLLLFSRLLAGMSAGNMTIAQAAVSGLVESEKRAKAMAIFNIAGGVSWVIAPYGGSILSESSLVSWFSFSTPFWVMGMLFALSGLVVFVTYRDPKDFKRHAFHPAQIVNNFRDVLKQDKLRTLILMSFASIFGWLLYQGFMSTYLEEQYHFSEIWIGRTFAYFSFFWFVGGLIASQWVFKHFSAEKILLIPLIIVPCALVWYLSFDRSTYMWIVSAVANCMESLVISCFFALFAQTASSAQQGKVFGLWNACFAFSLFLPPIIAGVISNISLNAPFALAVVVLLSVAFWFWRWERCQHKA